MSRDRKGVNPFQICVPSSVTLKKKQKLCLAWWLKFGTEVRVRRACLHFNQEQQEGTRERNFTSV